MTRSRLVRLIACLAALALGFQPLYGTTFIYQTTLDLLKASDAVVVGTVTATRCEERNGQIVTITTVQVEETWKGQTVGKTVEIVESGGIVGDRGSSTGGAPQFKQGDRVVAFLEKNKADPDGRMRTTTGVAGRHLIVDRPAGPPATPAAILARPSSDANCDIAGHDALGRTVLLEFAAMMRLEGQQGTTLDEFRTEVAAYQAALDAGQAPPLSKRDHALADAFQNALNTDTHHTRTSGGAAAGDALHHHVPPGSPGGQGPANGAAASPLSTPGIIVREEDVDRILREHQERLRQEKADTEQSHTVAWVVFFVSGVLFVGLTIVLRRRRS